MDETKQPGLRIAQIFLSTAHLEHRQDALGLPPDSQVEIQVTLNVTGMSSDDEQKGLITFSVASNNDLDPLYRFQVELQGIVEVDPGAEPNLKVRDYLQKFGPSTLFPFLREAVANLTGRGRFGPIWLKPMNFHALNWNDMKSQATQATE